MNSKNDNDSSSFTFDDDSLMIETFAFIENKNTNQSKPVTTSKYLNINNPFYVIDLEKEENNDKVSCISGSPIKVKPEVEEVIIIDEEDDDDLLNHTGLSQPLTGLNISNVKIAASTPKSNRINNQLDCQDDDEPYEPFLCFSPAKKSSFIPYRHSPPKKGRTSNSDDQTTSSNLATITHKSIIPDDDCIILEDDPVYEDKHEFQYILQEQNSPSKPQSVLLSDELDQNLDFSDDELKQVNIFTKRPRATPLSLKKLNFSGKKVKKLKGTSNARIVKQSLFTELEQQKQQQKTKEPELIIKQADAVKHVIVRVSHSLFEIIQNEFRKICQEKELTYAVEADHEDSLPCVLWRANSQLETIFKNQSMLRAQASFDQILIFIQPDIIHECVSTLVKRLETGDNDQDSMTLFEIINKTCKAHNIYNITIVLFGLERYLRSERSRINNSFKRRMKEAMHGDQVVQSSKTKSKHNEKSSDLCELTMENIEMCLVDFRMQFFYQNETINQIATIQHENVTDLAETIFRYSRSLAESIYRKIKSRSTCIDMFAVGNDGLHSIDPCDDESRRALWLRQLQQFPSITPQAAEMIVSCFPTPKLLFQTLNYSTGNIVRLLAETGIGNRRIGFELASKIVQFMTSTDGDAVLKTLVGTKS